MTGTVNRLSGPAAVAAAAALLLTAGGAGTAAASPATPARPADPAGTCHVETLSTPSGPVAQGTAIPVTWTLVAGSVAPCANLGVLTAQDMTTKNTTIIDAHVDLATRSYNWTVAVPPGTYTLGLNDGGGAKQSGPVTITCPAPGGVTNALNGPARPPR
jgi:hypothetical protein